MPRKSAGEVPLIALDFSRSLQRLTPDVFFRFIHEYPNQQGTQAYVYRLVPPIDRKLAGIKDSNIDSLASAQLDEDYLLRTHGSGKYHLKFSDANKPKGLTEVAKTTVEIWDPAVEPNLNPVELVVDAPGNERWVRKYQEKGWIVQDGRLTPPQANDGAAGKLADTVRDLAGQMAAKPAQSDANAALVTRALDVLSRPKDDLEQTIKVAQLLQPKTDPVQVQMMQVLVSMLQRDKAPEARPDPLEQIKTTAAFLKEMGFGAGGGGGSWIDAITALPGILSSGAELMKQLVLARAVQGKVVPIKAAPATPAANPETTEEGEGDDMLGVGNLAALKTVGEDAIDAFERGIDGADFAHGLFCRRGGDVLYTTVASLGKDQILTFVGMVPGLAERLGERKAGLPAWVDSFLSYGEPEPEVKLPPAA